MTDRLVADDRSAAGGGTLLATQIIVSTLVAVVVTVIWGASGLGYFWPMWVWLGFGIALALHAGLRWAWAEPRGRQRRLAVHGTLSVIIAAADVAIWVMSGGGFFWPVFPLVVLGSLYVLHGASRSPLQRDLVVRVDELTRTRRGVLDVQAAELRRIERDLHDGAQARLVALSVQLGRAEERLTDRPEAAGLVRRAREEAIAAITELRDLARGIAPPILADRGLVAAVQGLADRSAGNVTVSAEIGKRPPPVVETAAYFVVAESLTNAVKHAPLANVRIAMAVAGGLLLIDIVDDGPGGADPRGSGLSGLRQRLEALDGALEIQSLEGSGTTIRASMPCA